MHMQGMKQLERDTTVNTPVNVVYQLFMDNAELASWAPAVDAVTDKHGGDDTGLGATRTCAVTMNGKKGTMVERCVEAVPQTRASFLVVDDSFGFSKMLTDYGFTAHFSPTASDQTTATLGQGWAEGTGLEAASLWGAKSRPPLVTCGYRCCAAVGHDDQPCRCACCT